MNSYSIETRIVTDRVRMGTTRFWQMLAIQLPPSGINLPTSGVLLVPYRAYREFVGSV